MTIKEINKILIDSEGLFKNASKQFPKSERDDICQELRIWMFKALTDDYPSKKQDYKIEVYVYNQIRFCLRRLHFDIKVQEKFERDYHEYPKFFQVLSTKSNNDKEFGELIKNIVTFLTPIEQRILFFLLHNTTKMRHRQISKKMNIEYKVYKKCLSKIKKIVKNAT